MCVCVCVCVCVCAEPVPSYSNARFHQNVSPEPYSSLLEIHNSSILLQLSAVTLHQLNKALSSLSRSLYSLWASSGPSGPGSGRLPRERYFSEHPPRSVLHTCCHPVISQRVAPETWNQSRLAGWRFLIRQTVWRRTRVVLWYANCQSVEISFARFLLFVEEVAETALFLWHWSHSRTNRLDFINWLLVDRLTDSERSRRSRRQTPWAARSPNRHRWFWSDRSRVSGRPGDILILIFMVPPKTPGRASGFEPMWHKRSDCKVVDAVFHQNLIHSVQKHPEKLEKLLNDWSIS